MPETYVQTKLTNQLRYVLESFPADNMRAGSFKEVARQFGYFFECRERPDGKREIVIQHPTRDIKPQEEGFFLKQVNAYQERIWTGIRRRHLK